MPKTNKVTPPAKITYVIPVEPALGREELVAPPPPTPAELVAVWAKAFWAKAKYVAIEDMAAAALDFIIVSKFQLKLSRRFLSITFLLLKGKQRVFLPWRFS